MNLAADTQGRAPQDFDAFVRREHRRLSTALTIALDNAELGLQAADHALAWLARRFDPIDGDPVVVAFDRGLAWVHSPARRFIQRLPWTDDDPEDPLAGRLSDPEAASAYRRASPQLREAAVRAGLLDQRVPADPDLTAVVMVLAADVDPPSTSVEAIADLRSADRARRRMAIAWTAVVLLILGGLSVLGYSAWREDRIVTEVARPSTGAGGVAETPNLRLVWDTRSSPIGFSSGWAADGSALYVLSTAPPNRIQSFEPALWRTDDGRNWSSQILELSFNAGFTVFDGRLYVLSTGPDSTSTDPEFELRIDDVDGSQVRTITLDQLAPGFEVGAVGVNSFSQHFVGAGPGGVVVSSVHDGFVDFFQLMPAEFRNGSFWPLAQPDGLHIIDDSAGRAFDECMGRRMDAAIAELAPLEQSAAESGDWRAFEEAMAGLEERIAQECEEPGGGQRTVEVIPWADLGMLGMDGHMEGGDMLRSATTLHIDDPMADEPTITDLADQVPAGAHLQHIGPIGDGFVAVAMNPQGGFWTGYSADGIAWTFENVAVSGWPISAGAVDGVPMVLFGGDGGVSVVAFIDRAWSEIGDDGPGDGGQFPIAGGVGDLGLVAVYELFSDGQFSEIEAVPADGGPIDDLVPGLPGGQPADGPTQQFLVRYSADGRSWVPVLTTEPVRCCAHPGVVAVGSDRITISIGSSNRRQTSLVVLAELG